MTVQIPGHVPWVVHRIAVSGHYRDTFTGIVSTWSLADVMDANAICDALDDARAPKGGER